MLILSSQKSEKNYIPLRNFVKLSNIANQLWYLLKNDDDWSEGGPPACRLPAENTSSFVSIMPHRLSRN